jgi:two-component system, chemotaxis family, protein-glutamate methylesterase/glutaminase
MSTKRIRVLIVDDSAIARDLLERGLSGDPELEVVGKASDAYAARDKIVFLKPDVMTLDVEMPRIDGIAFLRKLMPQYPLPVIVVSAVTAEGSRRALEALEAGALDVVAKPSARDPAGLRIMISELAEKIKEASRADPEKLRKTALSEGQTPVAVYGDGGITGAAGRGSSNRAGARVGKASPRPMQEGAGTQRIIVIGASTGGTVALTRLITELPADAPPVLVVQHMPPVFTRMFAESLDKQSKMRVKEAEESDAVLRGQVLIAPGDRHMRIRKAASGYIVGLSESEKVNGHRPSVDVLFRSMADLAGNNAVAALLTGMGRDGADGMLELRRAGARCLAQDEATSVVFGMPREAWDNGSAELLVPIDRMAQEIMARVGSISPKVG